MSFHDSYRWFQRELAVAGDKPYRVYHSFLKSMGYSDFIAYVVAACAVYPRSLDACRDSLADLAHSLHRTHGNFRLSHEDQESAARLVERCGEEVIRILDSQNFYNDRINTVSANSSFDAFYDALTARTSTRRVTQTTFQVTVKEVLEEDMHSDLSNHRFESTQQWSH